MNYDELVFKLGIGSSTVGCCGCKLYNTDQGYQVCDFYSRSLHYTKGERLKECIQDFGTFEYNTASKKWIEDVINGNGKINFVKTRDIDGVWTFIYKTSFDEEIYGEERYDHDLFIEYCKPKYDKIYAALTKEHKQQYKPLNNGLFLDHGFKAIIKEVEEC